MDLNEYILSGILEDYVMGLASEDQIAEIEKQAELQPEIRNEIRKIQESLEIYASSFKMDPPEGLKERVRSDLFKEIQGTMPEPDLTDEDPKTRIIRFKYTKWLAAASVTLLILSSILNVNLFLKLKSTQKQLTALITEKEYLAQKMKEQEIILTKAQDEQNFLLQAETRSIVLQGLPKFPDAQATVFWNTNSSEVYLTINNLPVPESGKQYQLWAIVDGVPVDAGILNETKSKFLQKMNNFSKAQAFAITLERKGGNSTPTLEAMYVMGKV
ncbi:MAG: anti-sigma factor [Flavobacteriales bacterium]|nr:anti-sigma factor [Flavobacteriales bacterium]